MRSPPLTGKRQAGFEFSRLSKLTVSDAVSVWACEATFHGERVGTILRTSSGGYTVMANLDVDGKPTGLLADCLRYGSEETQGHELRRPGRADPGRCRLPRPTRTRAAPDELTKPRSTRSSPWVDGQTVGFHSLRGSLRDEIQTGTNSG